MRTEVPGNTGHSSPFNADMPTKLTQVQLRRHAGSKALGWLQLPAAHLQYKEIKIAPHIKLCGLVF